MIEDKRLKEAIDHCKEVASDSETCEGCRDDHYQLMNWRLELNELRKFKSRMIDAIFE